MLEPEIIVTKNFHHHHGFTPEAGIRVTLAQYIHNRARTTIGIYFDSGKEFFRQPAPPGKTLTTNLFNLVTIQTPIALWAISIFQFLFENPPVLKEGIPKDDLLDHRIIGTIQLFNIEDIPTEEMIGRELRLVTGFALSTHYMNVHTTSFALKPIRNIFVLNSLLFLEQLFNDSFSIRGIKTMLFVAIHAPTRTIKFVQYAEFFIE